MVTPCTPSIAVRLWGSEAGTVATGPGGGGPPGLPNCSIRVLLAEVPRDGSLLYKMVVITPTDTLVAKRAMISPLMARKEARGLSARRRPASSTAGRSARL